MGHDRTAAARSRRRRAPAPRSALSALLLGLWLAAAAANAAERIASLNLCTDSMLFELVDDARIASVTALSRDPGLSYFHARAAALPVNHGAVEEILSARPDLVLTGDDGARLAARLLATLDIPVLHFEHADTFAQYSAHLRRLADALGAAPRARAHLARLWRVLGPQIPAAVSRDAPRAIVYQPNGYTPGTQTLMHEIVTRAGLRDVAGEFGLADGGFVSLERLVAAMPPIVITSARERGAPSLAEQLLEHPALLRVRRGGHAPRRLSVAENLWTCAGGFSVQAISALRRPAR